MPPQEEPATCEITELFLQTVDFRRKERVVLVGFDPPSIHTMNVDKPMRGHWLIQAIARVNRVFKDKPVGHVVDYLGPE